MKTNKRNAVSKKSALTRSKNSNDKITDSERIQMVELKTSLIHQSEKCLELAASLQGTIPKSKWNSEQWAKFQKAISLVKKLKEER